MFKLMDKNIITIYVKCFCSPGPMNILSSIKRYLELGHFILKGDGNPDDYYVFHERF